jgi:hypothetical protein
MACRTRFEKEPHFLGIPLKMDLDEELANETDYFEREICRHRENRLTRRDKNLEVIPACDGGRDSLE